MIFHIILVILPIIMPYTILGENVGALILSIVAVIFLIKNNKKIVVNNTLIYAMIILNVIAIISQVLISPYVESFSGIFTYINLILYYLGLSLVMDSKNKENILDYSVYAMAILAMIFIVIQGLYLKIRIYGNIGYANSYGLLLLIGIYINGVRKNNNLKDFIEMILFLGIFFTGSRTTILLSAIYPILRLQHKERGKFINYIDMLESMLWAFIQYVIYSYMGIGSFLIAPVIMYFYNAIRRYKFKSYIYAAMLGIAIIMLILGGSNTIQRIRNISLHNGSFQERLVICGDATKAIIKNPMGNGINMFQYKLYDNASAFYDVKYIHNSFLQVAYDIGVPGFIAFIFFFVVGIIIITKDRKNINNKYMLLAYITIFIHGALDFDFSYSTFGIFAILFIVLSNPSGKVKNISLKLKAPSLTFILVCATYLLSVESIYIVGNILQNNGQIEFSNTLYEFQDKITLSRDYRGSFRKAQGYKFYYDNNNSQEELKKALEELEEAKGINNYDPRVLWNMSYICEKLGNEEDALDLKKQVIKAERFNPEVYVMCEDYLKDRYNATKREEYMDMIEDLKSYYYENLKLINPRSIYMKNQMTNKFENIRSILR